VEQATGPAPDYFLDKFQYDKDKDHYTCPQGHKQTSNDSSYVRYHKAHVYRIKSYVTPPCRTCPVKEHCTDRTCGRNIENEITDAAVNLVERTLHYQFTPG
jgi:hypothetical protein